ncbi:MAG: hypothetical protein WBE74_04065, partial [Terracidiphilus sp.]
GSAKTMVFIAVFIWVASLKPQNSTSPSRHHSVTSLKQVVGLGSRIAHFSSGNQRVVYSTDLLGLRLLLVVASLVDQRKTLSGGARAHRHGSRLSRPGGRAAIGTVRHMESFEGEIGSRTGTLSLVQRALEKAGIEFLNDERPEVRLRGKK